MISAILTCAALACDIPPVGLSGLDILYPVAEYANRWDAESGRDVAIVARLGDRTSISFPISGSRVVHLVSDSDHHTYRAYRFRRHVGGRWIWVILDLDPGGVRPGSGFTVDAGGGVLRLRVVDAEGKGYRAVVER